MFNHGQPGDDALFLQLDVENVGFILAGVFHRVCLGIVPDRLARPAGNRVSLSVRQSELRRATGKRVNHMVGMRMHGDFFARLDADIRLE